MAKATTEMTVIEKTYELVVWSCQHIGKFPRSHRFTLGGWIKQSAAGN